MPDASVELPDQYDGIDVAAVGGYPRDLYMGRDRNDVDLVVTGVTPEDMRQNGFRHIMSADEKKPVFIDNLKREVAIARTEKSTGKSHDDFDMDIVNPRLSHREALRHDLERRDLTMNAIAVDIRTGEVFDPFNGMEDIDRGVIRHVSPAFAEDPLRVVRVARYSARFGFDIADETRQIMDEISEDVAELTRGRLGDEMVKAMKQAENPRRFFDVLKETNALRDSFPEIMALDDIPAGPEEYHSEGSAYEHTMRVLTAMFRRRGNDVEGLLAALAHDIGKSETPKDILPHHYRHERRGRAIANQMRSELQISRDLDGVMSTASEVHGHLGQLDNLNITTILDIAERVKKSPLDTSQVADLGVSDGLGREPQIDIDGEKIEHTLSEAISVIEEIGGFEALENRDMTPEDVGLEVNPEQVGKLVRQDRAEELRSRLR